MYYLQFLQTALAQSDALCFVPDASWYVCHASQCQDLVKQALEANQLLIRSQIIWAKKPFCVKPEVVTKRSMSLFSTLTAEARRTRGMEIVRKAPFGVFDKPLFCDLHPTMKPWRWYNERCRTAAYRAIMCWICLAEPDPP